MTGRRQGRQRLRAGHGALPVEVVAARGRWGFAAGIVTVAVLLVACVTAAAYPAVAQASSPPTSTDASPSTSADISPSAVEPKAEIPFGFVQKAYSIRELGPSQRPFATGRQVARVDMKPHNAAGVRMRLVNGKLVDAPGAQAQYGVYSLQTYLLTQDPLFLSRTQAQADRLIERRLEVGAAWYYPSYYRRLRHSRPRDVMPKPWFSAMCQGHALALFVQLHEITGEERYRTAADATFASFLRRGPRKGPWTVTVDKQGYLWLEEWPKAPADHALNGHIFAAWGVYEYYRLTGDPRALQVFRGALTSVEHCASRWRRTGWISRYCLLHGGAAAKYHAVHIWQLQRLHIITGATSFALLADKLHNDYPAPELRARVTLAAGRHVVYRFDGRGRITRRRVIRLRKSRVVTVTRRARIRGRTGYWFRMSSGPARGLWVRERTRRSFVPGTVLPLDLSPGLTGVVDAGRLVGRHFAADGAVTATTSVDLTARQSVTVDRTAVVNGLAHVHVTAGPLAGWWLRRSVVRIR